jgi:hypothetical protein
MRLYEFASDDPYRVALTAVVSQYKARLKDSNSKQNPRTDAFINFLADNGFPGLNLDELISMQKQEPLKNLIKNISGREVTFFDADEEEITSDIDQDKNEKIVQNLAKKALK